MDLTKLYSAVKRSDRFIYDHYTSGSSLVLKVQWSHNPPKVDLLVWAKQYSGKMRIRPDGNINGIHIYASRDDGIWKVEHSVWYDGKESDLTASLLYNEEDQTVVIVNLHVM